MNPTSAKTSSAAIEKKDVQKLQRAIVDGLEDVKALDIVVFDTEHITSLFERVIIASGSSNRQTKALAASVRDSVKDAGFAKPRIEGEDNGEWIIVDCGAAVAHIMQPSIRQYYHLEELWGEKPVKIKLGAAAPKARASVATEIAPVPAKRAPKKPAVKAPGKATGPAGRGKTTKPSPAAKVPPALTELPSGYVGRVGKTNDWTARRNASDTAAELPPAKPAAKRASKPPLVKVPATKKALASKAAVKSPSRAPAKKAVAKKSTPSRSR
jgi:ribosome-associated protein